jgi:hypothetical protein
MKWQLFLPVSVGDRLFPVMGAATPGGGLLPTSVIDAR